MDDNIVYDDLEQNQECQDSKSLEDFTKPEKTIMLHVPHDPVPNRILEFFLMHSLSSKALMGFGTCSTIQCKFTSDVSSLYIKKDSLSYSIEYHSRLRVIETADPKLKQKKKQKDTNQTTLDHKFQRMVSDANTRTVHGFRNEQIPSTTDVSSFTNIINKTANRQLKQKEEQNYLNQKIVADTSHRMGAEAIITNEDGLRDEQDPSITDMSSHESTDSINTTANFQPKQEGKQNYRNQITLADTSHRMGAEAILTNEDGLRDEQDPSTTDVSSHESTDSINTTANFKPKQEGKQKYKNQNALLGQYLREGAEEIPEIGLRKDRVPCTSDEFGSVPTVGFFGTSIGQNFNFIKMPCTDISNYLKYFPKQADDEMDLFLLQLEDAIQKTGTIRTHKTENGRILILITPKRLLQCDQMDEQRLPLLTYIVDLKSLLTDAKDLTNLIKNGCYNETWLVENVASWLGLTNS